MSDEFNEFCANCGQGHACPKYKAGLIPASQRGASPLIPSQRDRTDFTGITHAEDVVVVQRAEGGASPEPGVRSGAYLDTDEYHARPAAPPLFSGKTDFGGSQESTTPPDRAMMRRFSMFRRGEVAAMTDLLEAVKEWGIESPDNDARLWDAHDSKAP